MKLLIATRSTGKEREARRLMASAGLDLVFPGDVGVAPTAQEDLLELGDSFAANARAKAEYFARQTGLPTVADDSGLEVFSLGGDPGVRSRRWAGATGSADEIERANNAELLRRLRGAPDLKRRARYRCVLVLYRTPKGFPETFEGSCSGRILEEPVGQGGFGYDPFFCSDELGRSFGAATPEEKDAISHRGRAFAALKEALAVKELS